MKVVSRKRGITKIGIGLALKGGVSTLALCAMSAAAPAWAAAETPAKAADPAVPVLTAAQASPSQAAPQDPSPEEKDIVVTGIRASLASAQNIKRNSDTVVDAITAQDIGALPDRSVTEALQRIPGVAMNRFAGSNDPDHFSVEGSGVVVRGLTFVRSEFNGRDTFSAGVGGQAINFADVPAELLGSVEVYKNSTAEMIEGGLAGTVNLNTRKPFDNKGFHFSFDVEGNYGDMKKKWSPTFSGLISDTWDTGIGTVGVLLSGSYSRLYSKSNGINISNIQTRDGTSVLQSNSTTQYVCRNPLPSNTDTTTLSPGCGVAGTGLPDTLADNAGTRYAPIGGQFREEDYDRQRKGIAFAAQWESLDRRALVTVQALHTDSSNNWGEHTFESASDLSEYNTYPAGCQQNGNGPNGSTRAECPIASLQNYTYDANGVFEKGLITYPGGAWRGDPRVLENIPIAGGMQQSLSRRQVQERNQVSDFGLNFKFDATEHLSFNFDADYTRAQHDNLDVSVFGSTFADNYLDLTGNLPTVVAHKPLVTNTSWTGTSATTTRVAGENDAQYFADRNNQFWRAAMDHIEHSTGHEVAVKGDVVYKFNDDGSFLKRFKFGARYADREQVIRTSNYNWGVLSEVWGGDKAVSFAQSSANSSLYQFDNFFRGATGGPPAAYYYNGDLIKDYAGSSNYFKTIGQLWSVTNHSNSSTWTPAAGRAGVIAGTPYLPSEIQPVSQKTGDAYMMLSFGREEPLFGGIKVEGNIGLRYVSDQVKTTGSIGAPTAQQLGVLDPWEVRCPDPAPRLPGDPPPTPPAGVCAQGKPTYLLLQQFAGDGSNVANSTSNRYSYFLPSLNLKFGLSNDMLVRFAASRVLTRPDMADLRNYVGIGVASDGVTLTTTAGNPYLKPARAWQFDLTYEWYFAKVGSLTIDAFYKDVSGFFYQNQFYRPITNNGVTLATLVRGPDNFPAHGKIKGVEVAYQQTFTFLPWIFSGLGTQMSYTYLKSSGIPNSFLNGGSPANVSRVPAGNLPLEQLSEHNVNATVFFEKGPVSLRAAYTWRSKFLLTASDVIFPYFPIYNDAEGHLDASAFINITKKIKLGVQGVNLTNTVTKTLQQYSAAGAQGPRSYFISDRRFSFILRGSW